MKTPKLHVYSPTYFHDHALIIGNKAALEELRDAITRALLAVSSSKDTSASSEISAFTADGEGFELKVYCEEENAYWDKASLPYTDKTIFCSDVEEISPWDLFRKYKK